MITVQDVRNNLKLDPNAEQQLKGWVTCVVAQWEFLTNRLWDRRVNHEIEFDWDKDTEMLWSPLYPIETAALTLGPRFGTETPQPLDPSGMRVVKSTGRIEVARGYWRTPGVARLTVTGGYTPATAPEDVRRALITQLHFMTRRMDAQTIIVTSLSYEKGSTSYMTADYHPSFKNLADQRRRDV